MNKPAPDPLFILQNQKKCPVNCLSYLHSSSHQKLLSAGNQDGDIDIWDTNVKRVITALPSAHQKRGVLWIDQFDTFPEQLLTTGRDGRLVFWSLDKTWKIIGEIPVCTFGFCKGCLIPRNLASNPWVAVPSNNEESKVEIFDLMDKKKVCELNPKKKDDTNKYGMCMAIRSIKGNENEILVGYENGAVALWDMREMSIIDSMLVFAEMVMCLCCGSSGHGWSGSATKQLAQWSVSKESGFVQLPNVYLTNDGINSLTLRNDEKILVSAGWDSKIRVFQAKNGKPLAVLSHHKKSIKDVTFSSDNYLAAGSQDGAITLWDIYR